jgi:hypothetical protein
MSCVKVVLRDQYVMIMTGGGVAAGCTSQSRFSTLHLLFY